MALGRAAMDYVYNTLGGAAKRFASSATGLVKERVKAQENFRKRKDNKNYYSDWTKFK